MVNTLNTWPTMFCSLWLKAMKLMFAAFIMSSIDIRMTMALRRVSTPRTPTENSSRLKTRMWLAGTGMALSSVLLARQHDGADHRHEQQNRGDLERQQVVAVQGVTQQLDVPSPAGCGRPQGQRAGEPPRRVDVQDHADDRDADDPGQGGVHAEAGPQRVAQGHQHDGEQEQDQ